MYSPHAPSMRIYSDRNTMMMRIPCRAASRNCMTPYMCYLAAADMVCHHHHVTSSSPSHPRTGFRHLPPPLAPTPSSSSSSSQTSPTSALSSPSSPSLYTPPSPRPSPFRPHPSPLRRHHPYHPHHWWQCHRRPPAPLPHRWHSGGRLGCLPPPPPHTRSHPRHNHG